MNVAATLPLTYRVLGTVQVQRAGLPIDLGFPQHRAVLAALLVDAGGLVPTDVLVERVWEGRPISVGASLHPCISRLRRALEPAAAPGRWSVLRTQAPGYRLAVAPRAVDAIRFAEQVRHGRRLAEQGHLVGARAALDGALALWRGRPYADVDADFAAVEARRLEQLRMTALELGARVDLRLGRHADLLDLLPPLLHADPLHEPLRACLVLALYRSGRQADALQQLATAREVLADELGIDPGPELRRLQDQVLRQDPVLDAPVATDRPGRGTQPAGAPLHRRACASASLRQHELPVRHRPAPHRCPVLTRRAG